MLVEKSLEQMLEEIHFQKVMREDVIVPKKIKGCPLKRRIKPKSNALWGFLRDKYSGDIEVAKYVSEKTGRKHGPYLIAVALENAVVWGNRNDPALPLTFKVYEGCSGIVVQIKDSGNGFDYRQGTIIVKGLRAEHRLGMHGIPDSKGRKYYHRRGGGFSAYEGVSAEIAFEGKGNIINIMYKFENRQNASTLSQTP